MFGDDDEDVDLFSRLEQQREELEKELGFEKFIEIYKTVQVRTGWQSVLVLAVGISEMLHVLRP